MLTVIDASGGYLGQTTADWFGVDAGVKLKSASTYVGTDPGNGAWRDDVNHGTDVIGFGAVPAGNRANNGSQFGGRGTYVNYWSSSVASSSNAWRRAFDYNYAQVSRYSSNRSLGFSVRCVRD
jgi:uncharacterized protein (TIGR02145 family)